MPTSRAVAPLIAPITRLEFYAVLLGIFGTRALPLAIAWLNP